MQNRTVEEAVIKVLQSNPDGLTPKEIYDKIIDQKLYDFEAEEPISVVDHTIRKSCVGVDIEVSKDVKFFEQVSDGKYKLRS